MLWKLSISALAILVGLLLITSLAEGIELVVVTMSTDKPLSELANNPSEYFAIRNQPLIITLKLLYNTIAAFVGGYVCTLIARRKPLMHGVILASIQTLGFVYGMTVSEFAHTTPFLLWLALIILTISAILFAGYLRNERSKYKS